MTTMTKKTLITIIGKQRYGNDSDKIELTTVGTLENAEDCYILRYNEEQEPPLMPLETKLTVAKDESRVELLRAGAYGSCLIIERSKRNLCSYGSAYGDLLLGIYGKSIEADYAENEGSFSFSYDIDVNGALSSQNEVTVTYKEM